MRTANKTTSTKAKSTACPPKLEHYIRLMNLIPEDFLFPNYGATSKEIFDRHDLEGTSDSFVFDEIDEELRKAFSLLTEEVQLYIFSDPKPDHQNLRDSTQYAIEMDEYLHQIDQRISFLDDLFWDLPIFASRNSETGKAHAQISIGIELQVKVKMNEKGYLEVQGNDFINLVLDNKIEGNRIRECVTCGKVFWADRSDMKACIRSCANAYRQKQWRERNLEEYNSKRRDNYRFKKNRDKKRTVKN